MTVVNEAIEEFLNNLPGELYGIHYGPSGRVYASFSAGQFHARLWGWDKGTAVLVTDTTPCMFNRWADVEIGMATLFGVADRLNIPLVGHPFVEDMAEWQERFPFLVKELRYGGVSVPAYRLVYKPGSRK